jgi:hypothetical protein
MSALLISLAVALALGIAAYLSWKRKQQRREDLMGFGLQYDLEYSRQDTYGLVASGFHLFTQGDGRGCENVLSGTWQGLPVREADYWYYTESSDSHGNRSKSYHYFSVVLAALAAVVPDVRIERESVVTWLADRVGLRDLEFESEEFNRTFNVKASDQEFAFKLVDGRMIQWLLASAQAGSFGFEIRGSELLVYCKRLKPTALIPLLGTAKAFHDHVPRLVWSEYGRQGERSTP